MPRGPVCPSCIAEEQVGGLDPGAGVVAAGADGHHVILAQVIRPPSPVTCTPQPAGPVRAASLILRAVETTCGPV